MAVDAVITDGTAVVRLRGSLDITCSSALAEQLAEIMHPAAIMAKKPKRLVFDLTGVDFMDCTAARVLLSATRSLPDGQRPVIRSANPLVRRLLQLTGLDTLCTLA